MNLSNKCAKDNYTVGLRGLEHQSVTVCWYFVGSAFTSKHNHWTLEMIQLKQPFKSLKASSDCRLGNFIFYPSLILKLCKHCSETFFQYEKQFQFFTESGNLKNLKLRLYLRFEICPKTSNLPKHNKNRAHQIFWRSKNMC